MCILWYNMPHAPLGVLDITLVAGNDVNMGMQDTLAGRWPYIDADIIAIRPEFLVQKLTLLGNQGHAGVDFFGRQVKKAGDMALRDDQGMPRAHREAVTGTVGKLRFQ